MRLRVVIHEDKEIGGYSGYFLSIPSVIVEGETKEELFQNLRIVFELMQNLKEEDFESEFDCEIVDYIPSVVENLN